MFSLQFQGWRDLSGFTLWPLQLGKQSLFLRFLMERCWLDLRSTASISCSSWEKAILCRLLPWGGLRKQYENDFFFSLLHNNRICCLQANANSRIKAKLKPFFYFFSLILYFRCLFFPLTIVYIMSNPILLCNREYKEMQIAFYFFLDLPPVALSCDQHCECLAAEHSTIMQMCINTT